MTLETQKSPHVDISVPKHTRSYTELCRCYISLTGRRMGAKKKVLKGRGYIRQLNIKIDKFNGLCGNSSVEKLKVNTSAKNFSVVKVFKICSKCLQEVAKSKSHACAQKNKLASKCRKNIEKFMHKTISEDNEERIARNIIKKKTKIQNNTSTKDVELQLSNFGQKITNFSEPHRKRKYCL